MRNVTLQSQLNLIGLVSRISHNLAKYRVEASKDYTPGEFIEVCRIYMESRKMNTKLVQSIIEQALESSNEEVHIFISTGSFLSNSNGGSSMTVSTLIGPVLDLMGYEENDLGFSIAMLKRDFVKAFDKLEFKRMKGILDILQAIHGEVGFQSITDEEEFNMITNWFKDEIEPRMKELGEWTEVIEEAVLQELTPSDVKGLIAEKVSVK
ncbi:hypothetical protein KLEB273_gp286 [Bacillus phage vB_BauM_KLEB27-3]|nr:hypothetical protein KLEB273_gp286 [Bacillus phage vB_BauM_KLEB27-3]